MTYIFTEKTGNAVITLSADNEGEAWDYLELVILNRKSNGQWRLEETDSDLENFKSWNEDPYGDEN